MHKPFIHADFLLETEAARCLYHEYAAAMPIIDYHCHLSPREIADDQRWDNMAQVWLYGDHYKWRAMRTNGVEERFCTGNASDREKFQAYAETMPYLLRNPLYHWSHLELARYFDLTDLLSPATADRIWEQTAERLQAPEMSARGLMVQSDVRVVCTTDDPVDSLEHHKAVAADAAFPVTVLPTWRPDKGMAIDKPEVFNPWVDALAAAADIDVTGFSTFLEALRKRHDAFAAQGCRLSDHGLDTVYADDWTDAGLTAVFKRVRGGGVASPQEIRQFKAAMLDAFARMDAEKGWTQQIHYGALRNNNSRRFRSLGPDTGFDSIGDWPIAEALSRFLDRLDADDSLPRTILYTLNPRDNEVLAAMLGNFQDGRVPGKIQLGSGWWFNDQLDGMLRQLEAISQLGLLSRFVGMLTDSRSFLSYTRHDYFRRILCNLLGHDIRRGLLPNAIDLIGGMVQDVSYRNAERYFGFPIKGER